ncbi:hypothetical protein DFJ74DRAFT_695810 [Hyaloraphidium curvatum]|nr:hypothetical protein DFJ74DRAFT_695810 [Hyaloraphidium curvatum]
MRGHENGASVPAEDTVHRDTSPASAIRRARLRTLASRLTRATSLATTSNKSVTFIANNATSPQTTTKTLPGLDHVEPARNTTNVQLLRTPQVKVPKRAGLIAERTCRTADLEMVRPAQEGAGQGHRRSPSSCLIHGATAASPASASRDTSTASHNWLHRTYPANECLSSCCQTTQFPRTAPAMVTEWIKEMSVSAARPVAMPRAWKTPESNISPMQRYGSSMRGKPRKKRSTSRPFKKGTNGSSANSTRCTGEAARARKKSRRESGRASRASLAGSLSASASASSADSRSAGVVGAGSSANHTSAGGWSARSSGPFSVGSVASSIVESASRP